MHSYQPTSELGWIDFSDNSRKKMLKVLEALDGKGVIDELGIGSIRNAFSNKLFPATSTLMTRAKYYLFIPYILKDFLQDKNAKDAKVYLKQKERWLVSKLIEGMGSKSLEKSGIIGYTIYQKSERLAAQPPSTIYWGGIRKLGLYQGESSLANYLEQLNKIKQDQHKVEQITDSQSGLDDENINGDLSFLSVPVEPRWKDNPSMELTEIEQSFLIHKVNDFFQESLLGYLLNNKNKTLALVVSEVENISQLEKELIDYSRKHHIPAIILKTLYHANRFWEVIRGAHLLFNVELHKRSKVDQITRREWENWQLQMKEMDWGKFDMEWFWKTVAEESQINSGTMAFVNTWFERAKNGDFNDEELIDLVKRQERSIKGKRAKLYNIKDVRYTKVEGLTRMEFRFGNVKGLIKDIIKIPENA